jgi:hypothetical protein
LHKPPVEFDQPRSSSRLAVTAVLWQAIKKLFLSLNKQAPEAVYLNVGDTVTERDIKVAIDVYLLRIATEN